MKLVKLGTGSGVIGDGFTLCSLSGFGNKGAYQTIVALPMNISTSYLKDDASFEIEGIFESKPHYEIVFQ